MPAGEAGEAPVRSSSEDRPLDEEELRLSETQVRPAPDALDVANDDRVRAAVSRAQASVDAV
jgi:hypothetical protein